MTHDEIENYIKEWRFILDEFGNKIIMLEEHIDKLHELINIEDRITASDVLCRLTSLETHKNYQIDENRKVSKKIEELDEQLKFNIEVFKTNFSAIKSIQSEKFHKCPACSGEGIKKGEVLLSMPPQWPECRACEGKGIVWG